MSVSEESSEPIFVLSGESKCRKSYRPPRPVLSDPPIASKVFGDASTKNVKDSLLFILNLTPGLASNFYSCYGLPMADQCVIDGFTSAILDDHAHAYCRDGYDMKWWAAPDVTFCYSIGNNAYITFKQEGIVELLRSMFNIVGPDEAQEETH